MQKYGLFMLLFASFIWWDGVDAIQGREAENPDAGVAKVPVKRRQGTTPSTTDFANPTEAGHEDTKGIPSSKEESGDDDTKERDQRRAMDVEAGVSNRTDDKHGDINTKGVNSSVKAVKGDQRPGTQANNDHDGIDETVLSNRNPGTEPEPTRKPNGTNVVKVNNSFSSARSTEKPTADGDGAVAGNDSKLKIEDNATNIHPAPPSKTNSEENRDEILNDDRASKPSSAAPLHDTINTGKKRNASTSDVEHNSEPAAKHEEGVHSNNVPNLEGQEQNLLPSISASSVSPIIPTDIAVIDKTVKRQNMSETNGAAGSAGGATAVDKNATAQVIAELPQQSDSGSNGSLVTGKVVTKLPSESNGSVNDNLPLPPSTAESTEPPVAVKPTTKKIRAEESEVAKTTTTTKTPLPVKDDESNIGESKTTIKSSPDNLPLPPSKPESTEPPVAVEPTTKKIQTGELEVDKTTTTTKTSLPEDEESNIEKSKATIKSLPVITDVPPVVDDRSSAPTSTTVQLPVQPAGGDADGTKQPDEGNNIYATQSPSGKDRDPNESESESELSDYEDDEKFDKTDKEMEGDSDDTNTNVQRPVAVADNDVKKTVPTGKPTIASSLKGPEPSSSAFMIYFLVIAATIVSVYIIYHNRQKLKGLIIEGRQTMNRRQTKRGTYSKLSNKADDVLPTPAYSESIKTYVY